MNWIKQIQNYQPYNEQEEKDQQLMLTCINSFDDVLTRENIIAHMTCSGFVLNKARDHVLMVYHNIYDSWCWTGGHADGEMDFLKVALQEALEETGVSSVRPITEDIISLEVLNVQSHLKKGEFISSHLHLNVSYILEAADNEELTSKLDENSGVAWIPVTEIDQACKEAHMIPIYRKILDKVTRLGI